MGYWVLGTRGTAGYWIPGPRQEDIRYQVSRVQDIGYSTGPFCFCCRMKCHNENFVQINMFTGKKIPSLLLCSKCNTEYVKKTDLQVDNHAENSQHG